MAAAAAVAVKMQPTVSRWRKRERECLICYICLDWKWFEGKRSIGAMRGPLLRDFHGQRRADILALKHVSSTFRQSANPVCGFFTMEQLMLCAVWPTENWLGSSLNQIQG